MRLSLRLNDLRWNEWQRESQKLVMVLVARENADSRRLGDTESFHILCVRGVNFASFNDEKWMCNLFNTTADLLRLDGGKLVLKEKRFF